MERPTEKPSQPDGERPTGSRKAWVRPQLVLYGPISKLTQGGSGGMNDGLSSFKM